MKYAVLIYLMLIAFVANARPLSEKEACSSLITVAIKRHLAIENPAGAYYCAHYFESKKYFGFQLHYFGGKPADWVGSDLVGYYAVLKKNNTVLEWDFIKNLPGAFIDSHKERNKP